jgi:recyclin-1
MAYDDSRWVQKLKRIGCWDEADARRRAEERLGTIANRESVEIQQSATPEPEPSQPAIEVTTVSDGFDKINLSTTTAENIDDLDVDPVLGALKLAKSIRGEARLEYGRIHAALAPFYDDITALGASPDNLVFKKYTDPQQQAQILHQLQAFAKCDMTEGWENRH